MGRRERLKKAARSPFEYCKEISVANNKPDPDPERLAVSPSSPSTSVTAEEPPKIHFGDVGVSLNMEHFNGFFEPVASSTSDSGDTTTTSPSASSSSSDRDDMTTITRPTPTSPNGEPPPNIEWSSAVGHAQTGKSGRVIHNLQEEIARLTRECSVQRSRAEEAQRSNEAYKAQLHGITDRLRNLEQVHETNINSIARKDRKIDSLREEIEGERTRRLGAEEDSRKTTNLAEEEREKHHRELAHAQEVAKLNSTQYDALVKTTLKQKRGYETRLNELRDHISGVCDREQEKTVRLERLDVIISQKNREMESGRERTERILQAYEEYKQERDLEIRGLIERGHQRESTLDEGVTELLEVRDKMKWTMAMKEADRAE